MVKAAQETFLGCYWQRCKVHFMRNILANVSIKSKKHFAEKLKQIWLQPDDESAKRYATAFMNKYELKYPSHKGIRRWSGRFTAVFHLSKKISSTNLLERLNKEIRRRTKVVGIFPSMDAYVRLVTSYLIDYSEDWSSGRSYINPKIITDLIATKTA